MAKADILVGSPELPLYALLTRKWRPPEFVKKPTYLDESEDDETTAGKMPPAEESDPRE